MENDPKNGYRVYKFISVGRIYEKSNYLIKMTLSIEAQTHLLKILEINGLIALLNRKT